ncbi:MAG: tetratricopeptide repeat protein [Minisyncoccota bacterium]
MQITKRQWVVAGIGIVAVVFLIFGWMRYAKTPAPSGTSDLTASSTTPSDTNASSVGTTTPNAVFQSFPINASDTIASWSFKGAYAGNSTLIAQADTDIAKLTGFLGKGTYDDYDLYNGIANDYASLGNGTTAYQYYNRSIRIHPNKGLAYTNLAHLMNELGAYHTAADAYAKAVEVQPSMLEYHLERLAYLTQQFPKDNASILAAFTDASKQFGDSAPVLSIEAEWLESQGRYADAIKAWQTVKALSPADRASAIDTQIARDMAKE